jgi:hypothetical protein
MRGIRIIAGLILALLVTVGGMVLTTLAGPDANAASFNPTRTACHAFAAWSRHRTAVNLTAMLHASRHARDPVKTDILVVYTEKVQNDWYDLPDDIRSTALDCKRVH